MAGAPEPGKEGIKVADKKLSKIEICQRLAEIEGYKTKVHQPYKGGPTNPDFKFVEAIGFNEKNRSPWANLFDPVENDQLCFELIKKHKIVRKYESYDQMGFYYTDLQNSLKSADEDIREAFLVEEYGDNTAACLAIIDLHSAN